MKARIVVLTVGCLAAQVLLPAAGQGASTGGLTQQAGTAGCVSQTGNAGACLDGVGLDTPRTPAVSPDGRNVYIASEASDSVAVLDRDPATGALAAAGCVSNAGGECVDVRGLNFPQGVAVSPDGRNVYATSQDSSSLAIFDRNELTGTITQKLGTDGCFSHLGDDGCAVGTGLYGAQAVAVSPDGRNVYVAALFSDAVAVFGRDPFTGALSQVAGCVDEDGEDGCQNGRGLEMAISVSVSADGLSAYATSVGPAQAIVVMDRNPVTGALTQKPGLAGCVAETGLDGCADGFGLQSPRQTVLSADGRQLYAVAANSNAVTTFDRDVLSGALTQRTGAGACVSESGTGGMCQDGVALGLTVAIAAADDGRSVYAAAVSSGSVVVLVRDVRTGALTQRAAPGGCVSDDGTSGACVDAALLGGAGGVTLSPGGRNAYVTGIGSDAVAVFDRGTLGDAVAQKAGLAGCVVEFVQPNTGCRDGFGLGQVSDVAVSPDGRHLYAASGNANGDTGDAITSFDRDPASGELTQKIGAGACVSKSGSGGACRVMAVLDAPYGIEVSPDGRNVYVSLLIGGGVVILDRDPLTGTIVPKAGTAGCVTDSGSAGACQDGTAIRGALSTTTSPDGRNLYVAGYQGAYESATNSFPLISSVAIFDRDPATGALTQKAGTAGCWSETGDGGACQDGRGLRVTSSIAVSPDGRNVYSTATQGDAVAIFDRDVSTGALTQKPGTAGCIWHSASAGDCQAGRALDGAYEIVVAPDGRAVYTVAINSGAVAVFDRDLGTGALAIRAGAAGCVSDDGRDRELAAVGTCQDGRALRGASGLAVSPDRRTLLVAAERGVNALVALDRNPVTGAITPRPGQASCIAAIGASGECQTGRSMAQLDNFALSPDGRNLYMAAFGSSGISSFDLMIDRPPVCTAATRAVAHNTANTVTLACSDLDLDVLVRSIASGPANGTLGAIDQGAGTVVYTPNSGFSGSDSFAFRAADGDNSSVPVTIVLNVAAAPPQQQPPPVTPGPDPGPAPVPDPTPLDVPPAGVLPVGAKPASADVPVGSAPPAFGAQGVIGGLPSNKACLSRRNFRITIRKRKGRAYVAATVFVSGRRVKVINGRALSAPVDLRGLPRGRFTVKIIVLTSTGEVIQGTRKYRTCARKLPGSKRRRPL